MCRVGDFVVCCILLLSCPFLCYSCYTENVEISVSSTTTIAETDDNFICATLDWWPSNKCDYNQCPWGQAGLLNLDLTNKILTNALRAFDTMRIRIGGSLQDQVTYQVGDLINDQQQFRSEKNGMFGFSGGSLPMNRWDELNCFFNETNSLITFGLNALIGKSKPKKGITWTGDWSSQNARDFMKYTISKGYKIHSYELGNELCAGGVAARLEPEQYAKDITTLKALVNELYPDPATQPKVLGPAGFFDKKWFAKFLEHTGKDVVDGVTHHIYNLGAGVDPTLIRKVQDSYFLSQIEQTFQDAQTVVKEFAPWSGPWVGESGGAYNSGGKDVSHTFADGFWYLDQLGMTSKHDHKVYCRQALIGGNYALLNTTTFIPNPDYYGALLWHRLMGKQVLATSQKGSAYLRTYSHCSKKKPGVTILFINMSNSTQFEISVIDEGNMYKSDSASNVLSREEYHLTPQGGNIQSDVVLLNGTPLKLTPSLEIPELKPKLVDPSSPIVIARDSIVFVTIRDYKAPACA
ncbi:hypothetical protein K2173_021886 [Erythroxylum novogranatense]|uniref:Heparanase-like protein 1 n=1 Tax=Erythroxylum novogranatense TaxID=1862640 RepID=A0AAV8T3K9_9ROSI|nr:hypothetical protein K2173_021886 [Erythroxylum novogranatense]